MVSGAFAKRCVVATLAAAFATGLCAQTTPAVLRLANPNQFRENLFDSASRGLGTSVAIAGVRLEGSPQTFDPKAIQVVLGPVDSRDRLCVRMISRDGRYSARAQYRLSDAGSPMPLLETRTEYAKQLAAYKIADMAVVARSGQSCDDIGAQDRFFAVQMGAPRGREVVVQLTAGETRTRAQIGQDGRAVTEAVVCRRTSDEVRIGFSQECRMTLPEQAQPGDYQLSIGETTPSGEIRVQTYALALYFATQ